MFRAMHAVGLEERSRELRRPDDHPHVMRDEIRDYAEWVHDLDKLHVLRERLLPVSLFSPCPTFSYFAA